MYTNQDVFVEECCYDLDHVFAVCDAMETCFDEYFEKFIETSGGNILSQTDFDALKKKFKVCDTKPGKANHKSTFITLLLEAYENFEKDRQKYKDIFDEETLDEWEDDPATFKSKVLRDQCPIIHATIYNKRAKELDKYRYEFSIADANDLLTVVYNLCVFGNEYISDYYDEETYDENMYPEDLGLGEIDTEDYTVYGVIGGGIKSHMLYKVHPSVFPNRSRSAIWALWYLTGKEKFGCKMDSEFIMIDINKNTIQQNYFYPYELFGFYAFRIYLLLKEKAEELGVYINPEYRYVAVDSFLKFVTDEHEEEIAFFKSQIRDGGFGYA